MFNAKLIIILDALKALMLIPRTPSPVPLAQRDVDELSVEQMRELLRQHRAQDQHIVQIKRERDENEDANVGISKRTRGPTVYLELDENDGFVEVAAPSLENRTRESRSVTIE
jgi:hypothetical protein